MYKMKLAYVLLIVIAICALIGTSIIEAQSGNYAVGYNGTSTQINAGSGTSIDNLHQNNAFTVEMWVYANGYGSVNRSRLIGKSGWYLDIVSTSGLLGVVGSGTVSAQSDSGTDEWTNNAWHHVAMTYNDDTDRVIRLFVDGVEIGSYVNQIAATGVVADDSSQNLRIGTRGDTFWFNGNTAWIRVSNNVRYTSSFSPPDRCTPPSSDGNTVLLYRLTEGSGTNITDSSPNSNTGTLSSGTWLSCSGATFTPTPTTTPTFTPTITPTPTPTTTPTFTPTPAVGVYSIELPSAKRAEVEMRVTVGDLIQVIPGIGILAILVFDLIRRVSHILAKH